MERARVGRKRQQCNGQATQAGPCCMCRCIALGKSGKVGSEDHPGATTDGAREKGKDEKTDAVEMVVDHGLGVPVPREEQGDG